MGWLELRGSNKDENTLLVSHGLLACRRQRKLLLMIVTVELTNATSPCLQNTSENKTQEMRYDCKRWRPPTRCEDARVSDQEPSRDGGRNRTWMRDTDSREGRERRSDVGPQK